jgi:hypothetical protein
VRSQGFSFNEEIEKFKIANAHTWEWLEELENKEAQLEWQAARLRAVKESWSWRVTTPLRWGGRPVLRRKDT